MRIKRNVLLNKNLLLLFAYLASYLVFLRLSAFGGGLTSLSTIDFVVLAKLGIRLATFFIAFIYLFKLQNYFMQYMKSPFVEMLLFLLFALLSIVYSADIFISSFRLFEHMGYLFFTLIVVINLSHNCLLTVEVIKRGVNLVLYGSGVLVAIVWVTWLIAPSYALRHIIGDIKGLGGDVVQVHTLANIACLIYSVMLNRLLQKREKLKIFKLIVCVVMLVTIYMTHSRGGLAIASVITLMIFFHHKYKKISLIVILLVGLFVIYLLVDSYNELFDFILRGQDQEEFVQLTGRMAFWYSLLRDTGSERFFIGYGYQMLGQEGMVRYIPEHGYTISNAHNVFIQTFVGLGMIGLLLLIFHLVKVLISLRYVYRYSYANEKDMVFELFVVITVCVLASLTQFGIVGLTTPIVPAYFMAIVLLTYSRVQLSKRVRLKTIK